jgi:hypothetical protein
MQTKLPPNALTNPARIDRAHGLRREKNGHWHRCPEPEPEIKQY